jgi:hypothetical protein
MVGEGLISDQKIVLAGATHMQGLPASTMEGVGPAADQLGGALRSWYLFEHSFTEAGNIDSSIIPNLDRNGSL